MMTVEMSAFARTIYKNKYAHPINGRKEEWPETAERVARSIVRPYLPEIEPRLRRMIEERKFMPGGRYLYAAGRPYPQIANCFLLRAEDSREGWGDLLNKCTNALMTGGGVGVDYTPVRPYGYPTKGMGGIATGPLSLAGIVNEAGRRVMQGGSRRSALWAGLAWWHPDTQAFIQCKDWSAHVREGKRRDFNFPAEMDMTNISVILDEDFFTAMNDPLWRKTYNQWGTSFERTHADAQMLYTSCIRGMLSTGEPGFSVDVGKNTGQTLRNAPVHGDTTILTSEGHRKVRDVVGKPTTVWTGRQWAAGVVFRCTKQMTATVRVKMYHGRDIVCDPSHPFLIKGEQYVLRIPAIELTSRDQILTCYSDIDTTSHVLSIQSDEPADVYCADVGVEEHSFWAEGVLVSNCTEVCSDDDSDNCNLGSLNLARYNSLDEFAEDVRYATQFLLCGSLAGVLPLQKMNEVREKNRRIGLGLMGVHEWLLQRGYHYEPCEELGHWMTAYARNTEFADDHANRIGIARPKGKRAMAPCGTIAIVAETTSSGEPILAAAQKRRYLSGKDWMAQYIVDPTAHRLISSGKVTPSEIEDAMTLSRDVRRRIAFQSWVQSYVDHGVSSTINLPSWGSEHNNEQTQKLFSNTLLAYLPTLRGITTYPDGSRDGQPLNPIPYEEAIKQVGVEFIDAGDCKNGVCGA